MTTTLLQGDCHAILPTLPAGSVQCVVTSPPYFGLRDYGVPGQLGLEPTPDAYVQALVSVFREVWRVLRDDGTVWLNLGDSYASGKTENTNGTGGKSTLDYVRDSGVATYKTVGIKLPSRDYGTLAHKQLLGIPWRVAFALQADGWYLRSDIIWAKPNPMPESVTDRPTKAHEYIFLLSKSERYYYDAAAIAEPAQLSNRVGLERERASMPDSMSPRLRGHFGSSGTRNRRSVWTVATQPYTGAHFATFPEKLIEPCILAGSAARACEVCGAPWARVVESSKTGVIEERDQRGLPPERMGHKRRMGDVSTNTTGFRPTCPCPNDGAARSIVLDPFAGSGTTLRVAERLCRDSIGIDLGYTDLQEQRTNGVQKQMVDLL